jgi:uncharacterized protein (TIGR02996 family)
MARKRAPKEPEDPPGPPMTDEERAALDARVARMVIKPYRRQMGDRFALLYGERNDRGRLQMRTWRPATDAEIHAANLFYDAAHGIGRFAKPLKDGKPPRRTREHLVLIAGILADRDDDTGYLAYADYLTENGDPQGDFIRLTIEQKRLPPGSPESAQKGERRRELIAAHQEEWFAPLGLRPCIGRFSPWYWLSCRRGVIEEVVIDRPGVLPENARHLFAAAPFLRKLAFEKGHLDPAGLARVKQLVQIEELELGDTGLTTDGLRALLRSKHLTGLKTLNLSTSAIGDAGAAELIAWPGLARLEALDVSGCQLTGGGFACLVASEKLAHLKLLRIGRNEPGPFGLDALLRSAHLGRLTSLDLRGTELGPISAPFRAAAFVPTLTHLDLDSAMFQAGMYESLTQCALPALKWLRLSNVPLGPATAGELAGASFRATLEELYLENCNLGMASGNFFNQAKFPNLRTLDLSNNRIERYGLEMLASRPARFPALTNLQLGDNQLSPEAVAEMAKSKVLAKLTDLDLHGNKIGPAGAIALADSKYLTELTALVVDEKTVGKKGKRALLDRFGEQVVRFQ